MTVVQHGARLPVYRQIADRLRAAIEAGAIPPGDRLPSEAALVAEYDVSRGTARRVHRYLASLGLVEVEPGRGAYVVERQP